MNSGPKPITNLLHTAHSELGMILRQAEYLRRVAAAVITALPAAAADHVHVASVDNRCLVVHTDNTGWATRLRYAEPAIRRALAQRLRLHVDTLRVRVRPQLATVPTPPVIRYISPANCDYMRRVADHIDDATLAQALRALANQGANKQTVEAPSQAAATGRAVT